MSFFRDEDGAALLTVLLLVSVMSAAMVATLDVLGMFTRSAANNTQTLQAREYALAAEVIGAEQAQNLARNRELSVIADLKMPERRVSFQIDGGEISGELVEYTNCFNLASLVRSNNSNEFEVNQIAYDQYVRLLSGFGIGERHARALTSALVDWQDSDDLPMPLGAESFGYSQLDEPYRASNVPISQIEELRLIKGYSADLIEVLNDVTCVDPVSMDTVINVNTADVQHAALIHALIGLPLSNANIASVLETRPVGGFDNISRFWNHEYLRNRQIDTKIRSQFSIVPKRYKLFIDVQYGDVFIHQVSLIGIGEDQSYHVINRKFGA